MKPVAWGSRLAVLLLLSMVGLLAAAPAAALETISTFAADCTTPKVIFQPGDTKDRLDRPELWFALALGLAIIGVCGFIATRPQGTTGPLENDVVIGSRPFFEEPLPPVDVRARTGARGNLEVGRAVHARNCPLFTTPNVACSGYFRQQ